METNSNSLLVSAILSKARHGTFTGLILKKKGEERGRGTARMVYGDDTVHSVVVTGFGYLDLVKRSAALLETLTPEAIVAEAADKGLKDKDGKDITLAAVEEAKAEMAQSFKDTLAGVNESTTDHVYEPLIVDGEAVRGARVYHCVKGQEGVECKCRACTGDPRAPLDKTVYLPGLQIWSKIIIPAPNGPVPKPKSAAKTVAKNLLKKHLPVSRFVSYVLEPGTEYFLRVGGTAQVESTKNGFLVTDDIVKVLAG